MKFGAIGFLGVCFFAVKTFQTLSWSLNFSKLSKFYSAKYSLLKIIFSYTPLKLEIMGDTAFSCTIFI